MFTATEQVRLLADYQRDCWAMYCADVSVASSLPLDYDPADRNYWMILPAERGAYDWQYLPMDASCRTCHRDYDEHGLDGCVLS